MALKPTFLAAENSAAERRSRALHRFIVASPVLLLVAVGLVGHRRRPSYASPAGTSEYDRRVLAFRERVVAVEAFSQDEEIPLRPVLEEARRWVAGFDAGTLRAVPPAAYEDHLRDGVRGEIFRSGLALASELTTAAERTFDAGRSAEAARGALAAARLANGLRGFELQACLQALLVQRRSVALVARAWPSLPASDRSAMREPIAALRVDPKEVERLSALEDRQLQDYFRRQRLPAEARQSPTFGFSDQVVLAIRRSVRLGNERIDALLKDAKARS